MYRKILAFLSILFVSSLSGPALAQGDLLVAPTRVILDGERGAEVYLNNTGSEPATYRISLEIKRMTADGKLIDIPEAQHDAIEATAVSMVQFSPRRITLPPDQPQTVRIAVRKPEALPDGEYRVHMLFRAIPETTPVERVVRTQGLNISLKPIYGVTIPIIVRSGAVESRVAMSGAQLVQTADGPALRFALARQGPGSVYGDLAVYKQGQDTPIYVARGIAIYRELDHRVVTLQLDAETAAQMTGNIELRLTEDREVGAATLASLSGPIG